MTTLFNSAAPVKTARRPFAAGIIPSRTFEPSAADRSWWAQESDRLEVAREDARFDAMAAESAALDRHERGLCC